MNFNYNYAPTPAPWCGYTNSVPLPNIPHCWHHSYNPACFCGGWECCPEQYSQYYSHYSAPYPNTDAMKRRSENSNNVEEPAKKTFWAAGLLAAMEDPQCIVKQDDKIVIIQDKYPKAEFHYLVLPREDISSINKLNREHLPLLEHMEAVGQEIAKEHPNHKFQFGYHALASMIRLHLHVISDDFNSLSLKTKKHWNSFTTSFFIPSQDLIEIIKRDGKAKEISRSHAKELMDTPLKCHKCKMMLSNMPKLKQHLLVHRLKEKHATEK
ncbi:Aprataxin-like protein [Gryllus bimaculatus]|nr:Aprataxin-like protein [Gryllus bimaculatus]